MENIGKQTMLMQTGKDTSKNKKLHDLLKVKDEPQSHIFNCFKNTSKNPEGNNLMKKTTTNLLTKRARQQEISEMKRLKRKHKKQLQPSI